MAATCIKKIIQSVLHVTGVYLREIINTFLLFFLLWGGGGGGSHLNVSCLMSIIALCAECSIIKQFKFGLCITHARTARVRACTHTHTHTHTLPGTHAHTQHTQAKHAHTHTHSHTQRCYYYFLFPSLYSKVDILFSVFKNGSLISIPSSSRLRALKTSSLHCKTLKGAGVYFVMIASILTNCFVVSPRDYLVTFFCTTSPHLRYEAKPVRACLSKTVPKIVSCPVYST